MAYKFNPSIIETVREDTKKQIDKAAEKNKLDPQNKPAPQTAKESLQANKGPVKYTKKKTTPTYNKKTTNNSKNNSQDSETVVEYEIPKRKDPFRPTLDDINKKIAERGKERREQLRKQASEQAHKKELKVDKSVRFQAARFGSGEGATVLDPVKDNPVKQSKFAEDIADSMIKSRGYNQFIASEYGKNRQNHSDAMKATQREVSLINPGKIIPESAALDEDGKELKLYRTNDFETDFNNSLGI